jgi:hypothetical protein
MDREMPMDEVKADLELDPSILPIFQQYKQVNESWSPGFNLWSYLLTFRSIVDELSEFK